MFFKLFKTKYFLHLSSSYLQLFVSILIPVLLTPYMISCLGDEQYGFWILLNSILVYLNLSNFGFNTTLLKEVSKINDSVLISKYITTVLFFSIIISLMVLISSTYFIIHLDQIFLISPTFLLIAQHTFVIFMITFSISFVTNTFNTVLFAKGFLHLQAIVGTIKSILIALSLVLVLKSGYYIYEIALVTLIITIVISIGTFFLAKKYVRFTISSSSISYEIFQKMFIPSVHYFFISISAVIILYSDNIIISSFLSVASVAIYAIGYKLVDVSQKLLFKLVDVMIPDIAKLYDNQEYLKIYKLHNKMLIYSIIIAFFGYGVLFVYGTDIIELWVGKEYTLDVDIFRIFVLFGMWHTWVHVSAIFNVAMGTHKQTSYMGMLNAILNIVLSIILLEDYGLMGIALGTLISHIATNGWFTNYWFYKTIRFKINQLPN